MLGIGLGVLMSTLDSSIVNVSLPTLVDELDTTFAIVQWVVLSYLLVIACLILIVARLGDMLGKNRVYNVGLVLFTIGSLLCGLSPGVGWLIGFRALQGCGAVMMTSLGSAILTEVFPSSERGRALGISGGIVSVGIALGPAVGGLLIGTVGWRSVFLVNVPLGILAAVIVYKVVPPSIRGESNQRFDLSGALIMFVALGAYALAMTIGQETGFMHPLILGLIAAALVGLIAFVLVEKRVADPMIDPSMFKDVLFGVNLVMGFLVFIMIGGQFVIPFYLELVKGYSPLQVGLLMMVFPVMMGLFAPVSGALSDRFGSRMISLLGLVAIVIGCLLLSTLHAGVGMWGYVWRMAPLGMGMGMFNSPNNSAIMGTAPRERLGVASGLMALSRVLGQTSGLPLAGAIFSALVLTQVSLPVGADVTTAPPDVLVYGVAGTFRVTAAIIAVSTVLAAVALWIDSRQKKSAALLSDSVS
ncbi:MAG: DHA2 family efflux MFS transporter permease subunit [Anaerolineae bacterium]|nr:DHA2 family efflux MFS transporter permease subunit [Anaerolineae bacterium]